MGEMAFKAQLYQTVMGEALEMKSDITHRRSTNNFGTIVWQYGEVWPTGGWGSIEYGTIGLWEQAVTLESVVADVSAVVAAVVPLVVEPSLLHAAIKSVPAASAAAIKRTDERGVITMTPNPHVLSFVAKLTQY